MLLPRRPDPAVVAVHALFVSPSESDCVALRNLFSESGWKLDAVPSIEHARSWMVRFGPPPIVICERDLRDGDWKVLFQETEALPRPPLFIVCSRLADGYLWAEVLNLGGHDVLSTPFEAREVKHVVSWAAASWHRQWGRKPVQAARTASATAAGGAA